MAQIKSNQIKPIIRPILFTTDMVKAIKEGRKTQTRRIASERNKDVKPGDIFWVRESFYEPMSEELNGKYFYKADFIMQGWDFKWKPSIFMPKEACRLFLQVISVSDEKLHDITYSDAVREGILILENGFYCDYLEEANKPGQFSYYTNPRSSFMSLWKKINGEESWDLNPLVKAFAFKICERPDNFLPTSTIQNP